MRPLVIILLVIFVMVMFIWLLALLGAVSQLANAGQWLPWFACLILGVWEAVCNRPTGP